VKLLKGKHLKLVKADGESAVNHDCIMGSDQVIDWRLLFDYD
jgi:hypothetical protein